MGLKVAIVGVSGFVGSHLSNRLLRSSKIDWIRGLSRSKPSFATDSTDRFQHRECDLFSLKDVETSLEGADTAIYLVHSMSPSSELSQGSFEDYDLILADNFARACVKCGIQRVLYLSGIVSSKLESQPKKLSQHLRSRLEVEKVFQSYGLNLLSLRAGVIVGKGGSSFEIILRLVQRLPALICPAWTRGRSQPIHISDVCESFNFALENKNLCGAYDLAGPETLSYLEMIDITSKTLGKNRLLFDVPFFSPKLSRLWVSTVTGAPSDLVYPLIESLKHEMMADPHKTFRIPGWQYKSFAQALEDYKKENSSADTKPKAYKKVIPKERLQTVQSVQRISLPKNMTAELAAQKYTRFLKEYFKGLIAIKAQDEITTFYLRNTKHELLVLEHSKERSTSDRVLFYIRGGSLDKGAPRARLEFREMRHENSLIIAIHDFRPSLPWYIYKYTQAIFHLKVMKDFSLYLRKTKYLEKDEKGVTHR